MHACTYVCMYDIVTVANVINSTREFSDLVTKDGVYKVNK